MAAPGDATRWLLAIGPFTLFSASSTARRHLSAQPSCTGIVGDTFSHQLVGEVGSLWHYTLIVASGVTGESDGIEMSMPIGWRRSRSDNQTAGALGLTELTDIEPPRGYGRD
jgi:hypothetical protein